MPYNFNAKGGLIIYSQKCPTLLIKMLLPLCYFLKFLLCISKLSTFFALFQHLICSYMGFEQLQYCIRLFSFFIHYYWICILEKNIFLHIYFPSIYQFSQLRVGGDDSVIYTLHRLQVHQRQQDKQPPIRTLIPTGHFRPDMHVFRRWVEAVVPRENPRIHGENMQTPHRKASAGIRPRSCDGANHISVFLSKI